MRARSLNCLDEVDRHPHLGARLQHGGHRRALRGRGLAGARGGGHQPTAPMRRACSSRLRTASPRRWSTHRAFASRDAFDDALAAAIDAFAPDLVVLAGFMRILGDGFVRRYEGRLLNIHPSLLPMFPGLHTHQRAIDAGCKLAGATVHFVTPDAGPRADRHAVGGAVAARRRCRGAGRARAGHRARDLSARGALVRRRRAAACEAAWFAHTGGEAQLLGRPVSPALRTGWRRR